LGGFTPGPGNYHPRPILPKIHENKTLPKEWIEKHKKLDNDKKKSKVPDMGTYTHHPADFETFGKLE